MQNTALGNCFHSLHNRENLASHIYFPYFRPNIVLKSITSCYLYLLSSIVKSIMTWNLKNIQTAENYHKTHPGGGKNEVGDQTSLKSPFFFSYNFLSVTSLSIYVYMINFFYRVNVENVFTLPEEGGRESFRS